MKTCGGLRDFTSRTFAFANQLANNEVLGMTPWSSELRVGSIPNPYPSVCTLGEFWGCYLNEFDEIVHGMEGVSAPEDSDAAMLGGSFMTIDNLSVLLHTVDLIGKVTVQSAGVVSSLRNITKVKKDLGECKSEEGGSGKEALGEYTAEAFWEQVLGGFEMYDKDGRWVFVFVCKGDAVKLGSFCRLG